MPDLHPPNSESGSPDFERLFAEHESALNAYARAILPDWILVEKAVQEAREEIRKNSDSFPGEDDFLPWAKRFVRAGCLSAAEQSGRSRPVFSESVLELLADESEEEEDAVGWDQSVGAMRQCLNKFSKTHQELLLAPHSEEAREGRETSCGMLSRLRARLAKCIAKARGKEAD